jgi:hypothetical protein
MANTRAIRRAAGALLVMLPALASQPIGPASAEIVMSGPAGSIELKADGDSVRDVLTRLGSVYKMAQRICQNR